MGTSDKLLWFSSISLESVILFRAFYTGLAARYRLFYSYFGVVLIFELIRFYCLHFSPNDYFLLYWSTELFVALASFAVVVEIFRQTLGHYGGVARLMKTSLQVGVPVTLAYVVLLPRGSNSFPRFVADFGRDLRYVQAVFVVVILWLLTRYRIPMGRNLLGLIIGYSFWLAFDVSILTLLSLPGNQSSPAIRWMSSVSYVATLVIWCFTLWSMDSEPFAPK